MGSAKIHYYCPAWIHSHELSQSFGSGCTSLRTFSFRGLRSTQMWILPDFLGTTTMLAHQGVGSSTLDSTPIASILATSWSTFGCNGSGTCKVMKSVALGLRLLFQVSQAFKDLWERLENISATVYKVLSGYKIKCSDCCSPNRLVFSLNSVPLLPSWMRALPSALEVTASMNAVSRKAVSMLVASDRDACVSVSSTEHRSVLFVVLMEIASQWDTSYGGVCLCQVDSFGA